MSFLGLVVQFLSMNNIPLYGCTQFVYSLIYWGTSCLPPGVYNCEQNCCKHILCRFLCEHMFSNQLSKYREVKLPDCIAEIRFCLIWNCHIVFQKQSHSAECKKSFHIPHLSFYILTRNERGFCCSISSPALSVASVLDFGHSKRRELVSRNLRFYNST